MAGSGQEGRKKSLFFFFNLFAVGESVLSVMDPHCDRL